MNISLAKQQIKDTVEAYLKTDDAGMYLLSSAHQRPIFLLGAPGIGKTAIMEQVASELGIGIVSYSMTHHTRQSALGLPRIEHYDFEGFEYEASEYTMSEIIAAIYDYMKRTGLREGILFLDEINCVSETLYPSMLQFLQFKIFGKHKVPDGWVVVCAGNPPEYNRSVHEFDIVTLDRLREIDVEPDYLAWKEYATEIGLHPAVTTFLEAKKDCFYKVESKPGGGKAFVTARGWEDLARMVSLYEEMGKPVNRDMIVQFLRDDEIADQFSVYYALFQKYRSDYQVDSILSGNATDEIKQRAKNADFDEHLALIGLILDVLTRECGSVLEQEAVAVQLRDILRAAKEDFLEGKELDAVLAPLVQDRESALERWMASGTASSSTIRRERLVINHLRDFAAACTLAKTTKGESAFRIIEDAYKQVVGKVKPATEAVSSQMDAAFDFLEECLGQREMLVFVAELTTRRSTTQFISRFGNNKYYEHNDQLQVDVSRKRLTDRAEALDSGFDPYTSKDAGVDISGGVGLRTGGSPISAVQEVKAYNHSDQLETSNPEFNQAGSSSQSVVDPADAGKASLRFETNNGSHLNEESLAEYYSGKQFEYGFASICKMLLPASDLKGKKVLDIGSRRGRGVYKISSMVGNDGYAMGIDWSPSYVQESKDGINRAWHDSGLKGNNMNFAVAYPEDLIAAGVGTGTFDAVYVNNVITLFYDQAQAIREFGRVLKPGGLLIMETIFADRDRDMAVVDAARKIGNSIQAAVTEAQNFAWLEAAGFDTPSIEDEYEVAANQGYKAGETVPTVPGDEDVKYKAVSMYIRKK